MAITLFCGDMRDYLYKIECDCVITDPPYGLKLQEIKRGDRKRRREAWFIPGDQNRDLGLFLNEWATQKKLADDIFWVAVCRILAWTLV